METSTYVTRNAICRFVNGNLPDPCPSKTSQRDCENVRRNFRGEDAGSQEALDSAAASSLTYRFDAHCSWDRQAQTCTVTNRHSTLYVPGSESYRGVRTDSAGDPRSAGARRGVCARPERWRAYEYYTAWWHTPPRAPSMYLDVFKDGSLVETHELSASKRVYRVGRQRGSAACKDDGDL